MTDLCCVCTTVVEKCVNVCNFPWLLSNAYDKETGRRLAEVIVCVCVYVFMCACVWLLSNAYDKETGIRLAEVSVCMCARACVYVYIYIYIYIYI